MSNAGPVCGIAELPDQIPAESASAAAQSSVRSAEAASWLAIDARLAEFEAVRSSGPVDLRNYLPAPSDPLHLPTLTELIRVDLEFGFANASLRPSLDSYQSEFPVLFDQPERIAPLAFEEYRLRRQIGEQPDPAEYAAKYHIDTSGWPTGVDSLAAEANRGGSAAVSFSSALSRERSANHSGSRRHRLSESSLGRLPLAGGNRGDASVPTNLTAPAGQVLGFRLCRKLGAGAFGRVFLAEQSDLANRLVALKFTTELWHEPQNLARLQHTNIVPVYSVHRWGRFQVVCMPYFGSATLADVTRLVGKRAALPVSGKELLETLVQYASTACDVRADDVDLEFPELWDSAGVASQPLTSEPAAVGAAFPEHLRQLSYVNYVLWLGARLADGLDHAHTRGIIHRDLKPANILLADGGQPMLLDFNLSTDLNHGRTATFGGTLPYMAPEQIQALLGQPAEVDGRADIYALGLILHELLSGKRGFSEQGGAPQTPERALAVRSILPQIPAAGFGASQAVAAIVGKCLEFDPARRYQSAGELREDLELHLANKPLKFAANRSLRERMQKWWRRHPRFALASVILLAAGVLVAGLASLVGTYRDRNIHLEATQDFALSQRQFRTAQTLLSQPELTRSGRMRAETLCRELIDRYQLLDRTDWNQASRVQELSTVQQQQLREALTESCLLWSWSIRETIDEELERPSHGATPDAGPLPAVLSASQRQRLEQALSLNRHAETCLSQQPAPAAIFRQRANLLDALGDRPAAAALREMGREPGAATPEDRYLAALDHKANGKLSEALRLLTDLTRSNPEMFAAWLVRGHSHLELSQSPEAVLCYTACIALSPDSDGAYLHRGLAQMQLGRQDEAVADFSRVLELQPLSADAFLNRGLAFLAQGLPQQAVSDFTKALELGESSTRLYFMRSRARQAAGDAVGAKADFARGLKERPSDEASFVARGIARLPHEPQTALADFDSALALNRRYRPALQDKAHVLSEYLKQPEEAVAALNSILEWSPDDVLARAGRAVLLARQGKRDAAMKDAEAALTRDNSPAVLYQVAGVYAQTSQQVADDRREAFRLLFKALQQGYGFNLLTNDPDLDPLRSDPQFQRLVEAARELAKPADSH